MNRQRLTGCEGEGKSDHLRGLQVEVIFKNDSLLSCRRHAIIFPLMINAVRDMLALWRTKIRYLCLSRGLLRKEE